MKTLLEIEQSISPLLVAAAADAHSRGVFSTMREPIELARMRGALAAYEYEKQLLASRVDNLEPGKPANVDASLSPA